MNSDAVSQRLEDPIHHLLLVLPHLIGADHIEVDLALRQLEILKMDIELDAIRESHAK